MLFSIGCSGGSPTKIHHHHALRVALGYAISLLLSKCVVLNRPAQQNTTNSITSDSNTNDSITAMTKDTITTFIDDHEQTVNETLEPADNELVKTMDYNHDILEFLRRPTKIASQDITTSPEPLHYDLYKEQKPILKISLPSQLISVKSKLNKLTNFAYLRCDIKLKLVINCNPTISGKLLLVYSPYEDHTTDAHKLVNYPRKTICAYPSTELDLQLDTSTELTIPYLGYKDAYSLVNSDLDYVTVYLFALTFLRTPTGTNRVSVSVYASFDNITLFGPTLSPIANSYLDEKQKLLTQLELKPISTLKKYVAEIQVGVPKAKRENPNGGIISEIAGGVSSLAASVGKFPAAQVITKPIAWVADAIAGVASVFGFSKPLTTAATLPVTPTHGFGMTHVKGIDTSCALALNQDYQLGPLDNVFQTQVDEMDFNYFCANSTVIDVVSWVSGTPFHYEIPIRSYTANVTPTLTPFDFAASFFKNFRGTFCFKITCAKTVFHSGRLEVYFNIAQNEPTDEKDWPVEDSSNAYRAILDLTNDTEMVIKIPFVHNKLWMTRLDTMGYLKFRSISELLYSPAVDDTIDLVISQWVENVAFMEPTVVGMTPNELPTHRTGELQINLVNKASENLVIFGKLGNEKDNNRKALELAGGDYVENFRPLLRRFEYFDQISENDFVNVQSIDKSDTFSLLAHVYKMRRGGTRLKVYPTSPVNYVKSVLVSEKNKYSKSLPFHLTFPRFNPIHEISVPYYTPYRRIINNTNLETNNDSSFDMPLCKLTTNNTTATHFEVYRATDDDFSFGWLVGVPPMDMFSGPTVKSSNWIETVQITGIPKVEVTNFPPQKKEEDVLIGEKYDFHFKRDDGYAVNVYEKKITPRATGAYSVYDDDPEKPTISITTNIALLPLDTPFFCSCLEANETVPWYGQMIIKHVAT